MGEKIWMVQRCSGDSTDHTCPYSEQYVWSSLVAKTVKNLPAMKETWVQSLGQKDPLGRKWKPTTAFLLGEFHGQRHLVGYSPWACKESDRTEQQILSLSHVWFMLSPEHLCRIGAKFSLLGLGLMSNSTQISSLPSPAALLAFSGNTF